MKLCRALLALVLGGCTPTTVYEGGVVRGTLPDAVAGPVGEAPGRLTVVSYNVHLGAHPERIARALKEGGLGDADVYLIQESEDHPPEELKPRAQLLAAELGLAFVYAPARHLGPRRTGSHGLAVLSRWPIVRDEVIALPYYTLLWSSRPRIALGVVLDVAGTEVQVWNVHLDTRIAVEERTAQLAPVFEHALALPGLAIVGGDMNSWAKSHQRAVDRIATEQGFATPTAAISDSTAGGWLSWPPEPPMRLDAIYTRGFAVAAAGVDRAVRGSDHVPIWVQLVWPRPL